MPYYDVDEMCLQAADQIKFSRLGQICTAANIVQDPPCRNVKGQFNDPGLSSFERWLSIEAMDNKSIRPETKGPVTGSEDSGKAGARGGRGGGDEATIEVVTAIHFVDARRSPAMTPVLLQWNSFGSSSNSISSSNYSSIGDEDHDDEDVSVTDKCPFTYPSQVPALDRSSATAFHLPTNTASRLRHERRKSRATLAIQHMTVLPFTERSDISDLTMFHATSRMLRGCTA